MHDRCPEKLMMQPKDGGCLNSQHKSSFRVDDSIGRQDSNCWRVTIADSPDLSTMVCMQHLGDIVVLRRGHYDVKVLLIRRILC